MIKIHSTAIIEKGARIGEGSQIGPYCLIGSKVKIGKNNYLQSNVRLDGDTTIGDNNNFFHCSSIGTDSQDLKDEGLPTKLIIGNNNTFREFCTVNKSTSMEEPTRIGDDCLLMAYTHVAHNCILKNHVVLANAVNIAGHCHLDDYVYIGGMSALSQFIKIGTHAFIGGMSGLQKDVPPYLRGIGIPLQIAGINIIGLQRRGFDPEQIKAIKEIFKIFYREKLNVSQAIAKAEHQLKITKEIKVFLEFIKNSDKGIAR